LNFLGFKCSLCSEIPEIRQFYELKILNRKEKLEEDEKKREA